MDPRQNGADLVAHEHDRKAGRSFRAHEVIEPREILLQDFPVEKQERGEGLVLGGGGDAARIGKRVEKGGYGLGVKRGGVLAAMKFIISTHPTDQSLLGGED